MGFGVRVVLVSAVFGIAGFAGMASAVAAFPGTNGPIAFSLDPQVPDADTSGPPSQVFTIQPDGSGLSTLTNVADDQAAASPEFSPDGERIVYQSNESGAFHIWVMDADGSDQTQLTEEDGFEDFQPSWSPDGGRIVFSHCGEPFGFIAYCDIAAMDADGSNVETLLSAGRWTNVRPTYSPDGSMIAFSGDKGGFQSTVWVMNSDGSSPERLTKPRMQAFWPDWSPDGKRILFADNCCIPNANLWTVRPDGESLKQLTHIGGGRDYVYPSYSPSGEKIVSFFYSPTCDCTSLRTLRADGSQPRRLTGYEGAFLTDWGPGE